MAVGLSTAPAAAHENAADHLPLVVERDELIANQENLLNAYRCLFNVDLKVVPGSCPNPDQTTPGLVPDNPSDIHIAERDELVAAQEALLNAYRCDYNIDLEVVPPGGCDPGKEDAPTATATAEATTSPKPSPSQVAGPPAKPDAPLTLQEAIDTGNQRYPLIFLVECQTSVSDVSVSGDWHYIWANLNSDPPAITDWRMQARWDGRETPVEVPEFASGGRDHIHLLAPDLAGVTKQNRFGFTLSDAIKHPERSGWLPAPKGDFPRAARSEDFEVEVRIKVVNEHGESEWSDWSTPERSTPDNCP